MTPLARRYRLLLRSYPPGPRRDELLDTLLDCAPPDRKRPAFREVVNLTRHGLRARLGRPGSTAVVVFAVLTALICGWVAAAGVTRLVWEAAPASLPTGEASRELGRTAFPGLTVWGGGDAELFVPTGDGEGIRHGFADYWVKHTDETRKLQPYAAGVRDRLAAAGWQIQSEPEYTGPQPDEITPSESVTFWATKDNLVLSYSGYYWHDRPWYDADGAASFQLWRAESPAMPWFTPIAALLGVLTGWLLTGWVSRRTEGRFLLGGAVGGIAALGYVLMLPALLYSTPSWLPVIDGPPEQPNWMGFASYGGASATLAGWVALIVLAIAAIPRRLSFRRWPRWTRRYPAAALAAAAAVVGLLAYAVSWYPDVAPRALGGNPCSPSGPPAEPDAGTVRLSREARVFIAQDTTPEQRNLIDAAIFRVQGTTGLNFNYDPSSSAYRDAYCDGGRVPAAAGQKLPYFWDVWLSSPGAYPALEAEVTGMPGVVAVRHAVARDH